MAEPDITNYQVVSRHGDKVIVMAPRVRMTPDEALVQAAWLVAIAEHDSQFTFDEVLQLVRNT